MMPLLAQHLKWSLSSHRILTLPASGLRPAKAQHSLLALPIT